MSLKFTHVRAHQGIEAGPQAVGNEQADRFANKGAAEGENTILSDNSSFNESKMEPELVNLANIYMSEAATITEAIMASIWSETMKEVDIKYHSTKFETTSTKSTMTDYMPKATTSDRTTLINNANKNKKLLTKEAMEARIVELQVEVAKRQEMEDALQEKIKSLHKCLSVQENELIKHVDKPRESDFTTIQVNPVQLAQVKTSQEKLGERFEEGMGKISLLVDMFKSINTAGKQDEQPTTQERNEKKVETRPEED